MVDLRNLILPDGYRWGELPGESLPVELVRRGLRRMLPERFLAAAWNSILLGREGYWCFIVGLNNSGTTLLHHLLAKHSQIRSLPPISEGQYHTSSIPLPREYGVPRLFSARPEVFRWTEEDQSGAAVRALHDWGFQYIGRSGRVLLEKSPANALRSRWLQAHFRRPRFIAMFRHPCAVAEGIRRREGHDLRAAARHWMTANRILLEDMRHLDRVTEVRYEVLCRDPRAVLEGLLAFLSLDRRLVGEDFSELDIPSLAEDVDTISNLNYLSFDRLSEEDYRVIASEVGEVADRLGYRIPPQDE